MLTALKRQHALIWAFANRDFATRYRSSVLGWSWSLVQPLAILLIYAAVFSIVFRVKAPPMGNGETSYAAFLFTGMVTWNLFSSLLTLSMTQLKSNGELLKKVQFPAWAPVLGASIVQLIQVVLELVVLIAMFLFLGNVGWTWILAIPILISAVLIRILLPVAPPPPKARSPLRALKAHLRNTPILLNAFAAGTTFFAFVGLFSVLAYRLESSVFGMSHMQVGAFYIVWLVGALAPFAVRIAGHLGPRTVLPVFPVVAAAGLLVGCIPSLVPTIVGMMVMAGSLFFMVGVAQLLVPQLTLRDRGSAMSLHLTIYYLLGSLGPFVIGAAWSAWGWAGAVAFAMGALVIAFALAVILRRSAPSDAAPQGETEPLLS